MKQKKIVVLLLQKMRLIIDILFSKIQKMETMRYIYSKLTQNARAANIQQKARLRISTIQRVPLLQQTTSIMLMLYGWTIETIIKRFIIQN